MKIPAFFLPAYHSATGYVARKLADSFIGNFIIEDQLTTRAKIAIYAVRFFAQPLLWAAAVADIAFTAFIIPWSFGMSLMTYCCDSREALLYQHHISLFKSSFTLIPYAITLLFLPITGVIYAIAGKIIPVKIKRTFFESPHPTIHSSFKEDDHPEVFTQLLAELPIEERMETVLSFYNIERKRIHPPLAPYIDRFFLQTDESRKRKLLVEFNFTHRFASRDALHIRQIPKLHRLGISVDIYSMRIFQLMMQTNKGITSIVAQRTYVFAARDGMIKNAPQGLIKPQLNPCFASKELYDTECQEENTRDEDRLVFSVRELSLAIDAIKRESSYILKQSLLKLPAAIHPIVRDYMIGEDPFEHYQLVEWNPEEL